MASAWLSSTSAFHPDGVTLFVGLILIFVVFIILECCAVMRVLREDRQAMRERKGQ